MVYSEKESGYLTKYVIFVSSNIAGTGNILRKIRKYGGWENVKNQNPGLVRRAKSVTESVSTCWKHLEKSKAKYNKIKWNQG